MKHEDRPFIWLQPGEDAATSDDGTVRVVRDCEGSGNPAVFLSGARQAAPELLDAAKTALQAMDRLADGEPFDTVVADLGATAALVKAINQAERD